MNLVKKLASLLALWPLLLLLLLLLPMLLLAPSAWATSIQYASSHLGGTQWRYDYTIVNDTLAAPIDEFSIFFGSGRYGNLQNASTTPDCDLLVIQPDAAIPAAGYLDALALSSSILPGTALSGFAVTFDYFGAGLPPAQAFTVWDPVSFIEIDTGTTSALVALPLASTAWLLLAGILPLAWRRRKALLPMLLATTLASMLTACGGASEPAQQARLLAGATSSSDLAGASGKAGVIAMVGPFAVTAMDKINEQRVNRSTYDYTYRISLRNSGSDDAANVTATLGAAPPGTTIIDGSVNAGAIAAGVSVTPQDTLVLRIDRTIPFDPAGLAWNITTDHTIQMEEARPAEVYIVPLADLGFAEGADSVTVSGAITTALLKDGTLRYATPGDSGTDQTAQFRITRGGTTSTFRLLIRSALPTSIETDGEPSDDGTLPPPAPALVISGLGPNNTLQAGALTFRLQGAPSSDLKDDSNGLIKAAGNAFVSLKPFWTFSPADNSFTISASAMQLLLATLPNGVLHVGLNFVSRDGSFARVYDLIAIKASASISGKIVDSQGAEATSLAGRKILLRGYNANLRRQTIVDAQGAFSFDQVIPDTYQITLSDLDAPNLVSIGAPVFGNSTEVKVTLVYPAAGKLKSAAAQAFTSGTVTQDGTGPAPRRLPATAPIPKPAFAVTAAGEVTTFSATAAAQNQTISVPIAFTVAKGSSNVGVKITVQTAEYPVFTTQQSQYNDLWSYAVTGLPGAALTASGAVNQSHYTQAAFTRTSCVDVASLAKNAAFSVGGAISATNIGDSQLATVVTVELSLACSGLKVTLAKFTSPNQDAHPVLQPVKVSKNYPGPYISVSQGSSDSTHTLPLEIQYAPADADITEVNLSISPDAATPGFASANLLSQPHTKTAGKIRFPGLTVPAFAAAMGSGKVAVLVRVKGKVQGMEATSNPAEGGQVAFAGSTAFIPLSLAGSESGLSGRRSSGTRDAGGDSWATRQTITWLQSKLYRFDDISGQHVTQKADGDSILEHKGHSDGQQLDLRYADGSGSFSDGLGGQGDGAQIESLMHAAAAEVAANPAQKPKLALLVAWITANRATLAAEAGNSATDVIYIGPDFIKRALVDGKFSDAPTAQIPGIAAWTLPAKVQVSTPAHRSHWHISLNAHP